MTSADGGGNPGVERNWVELVATVLLAVATVATAWSGYQSTRWNGEQSKAVSRSNALRIESGRPPASRTARQRSTSPRSPSG